MTIFKSVICVVVASAFVAGCATPEVVQTRQLGDDKLNCAEIKTQMDAAFKYETDARSERGVTGTNVAAVLLFWPALAGTYLNTEDAIKAAKERQTILANLSKTKSCPK